MIEVVYSTSDFYAVCTGISIYSLLKNNTNKDININVITNNVTETNINRIKSIGRIFKKEINIIDDSNYLNEFGNKYHLPKVRGSYSTYFRLVLHNLLTCDKVLVIDSDTLVVGSISKLFEMEMENYLFLAVPEAAVYSKYQSIEDIDIVNTSNYYYNMGIVLMNLKKWREENIDDYLSYKLNNTICDFKVADQSIINRFLSNYIGKIDLKYNYYSPAHKTDYKTFVKLFNVKHCFNENEFTEAQTNPVILHFFGHSFERPWFEKNASSYKQEYMKYLDEVGWNSLLKKRWIKQKNFFIMYDYICYFMLKLKKYNLVLKFRYKYGQIIKSLIKVYR